jgi:hypothetical protein
VAGEDSNPPFEIGIVEKSGIAGNNVYIEVVPVLWGRFSGIACYGSNTATALEISQRIRSWLFADRGSLMGQSEQETEQQE